MRKKSIVTIDELTAEIEDCRSCRYELGKDGNGNITSTLMGTFRFDKAAKRVIAIGENESINSLLLYSSNGTRDTMNIDIIEPQTVSFVRGNDTVSVYQITAGLKADEYHYIYLDYPKERK